MAPIVEETKAARGILAGLSLGLCAVGWFRAWSWWALIPLGVLTACALWRLFLPLDP